jgi:hypothetical protein
MSSPATTPSRLTIGLWSSGAFSSIALACAAAPAVTPARAESEPLRRSSDCGKSWASLPRAPAVLALAAGGEGDWSLIAPEGIFRSVDDGESWQRERVIPVVGDELAARAAQNDQWNWIGLWRSACEGYAIGLHRSAPSSPGAESELVTYLAHAAAQPER